MRCVYTYIPVAVFFFFYRSGDHRDLHSFPTRRSSDLAEVGGSIPPPPTISRSVRCARVTCLVETTIITGDRSEEHTSELQSHSDLVCRLLLEKKTTADVRHPQ